jgi:hypothetical protein
MTRFVTPANQTAFDQEHVDFAIAAQMNFVSGTVRAHMGMGPLVINGNTFTGIGSVGNGGVGSISAVIEQPDQRNTSELYLSLSGVDPTLVGKVPQRGDFFGQFASVYFLPVDPKTMKILSPTEPAIFEGFMDQMVYTRKRGSAQIQLTVKHYDSLFEQTVGLLYTDESQTSLFSTDGFFSQLASLPNKQVIWGGNATQNFGSGGGGGGGQHNPGFRHP